jgi:hypothetical protein
MAVWQKIRSFREKLEARQRKRERQAFERELERSKRREERADQTPVTERLRQRARQKTAPYRLNAKAAKYEARKSAAAVKKGAIPGGSALARAAAGAREAAFGGSGMRQAGGAGAVGSLVTGESSNLTRDEEVMFLRAENSAMMGPPVQDAMLAPLSAPEQTQALAGGDNRQEMAVDSFVPAGVADEEGVDDLAMFGGETDEDTGLDVESGFFGGDE